MPTDAMDVLHCKVSLEILLLFKLRMKILTYWMPGLCISHSISFKEGLKKLTF